MAPKMSLGSSDMPDMGYLSVNDRPEWHIKRLSKSKLRADETHYGEIMVVALLGEVFAVCMSLSLRHLL